MVQGFERVLITGARGMLGSDLLMRLKEEGTEVFPFSREELDITDGDALKRVFSEVKPKVVINCAAYTDVDGCEEDYRRAFKVNGLGPRLLARFSKDAGFKLVHISTDYIFDGKKMGVYSEEDVPNPINVYGRSKLEGERGVMTADNYLIIRTAWLFGRNGRNFVEFVFKKLKTSGEINVIEGQTGSPTYTKDLSDAIVRLLKIGARGILNVVNDGFCTRYELTRKVMALMKTDAVINEVKEEELRRPARRPGFTPLSIEKLKSLGISMRRWEEAVEDYLKEMEGGEK